MRANNFIFTVSIGTEERVVQSVSGLGNEFDVVDFRESDRATVFKIPGRLTGSNITIRGVPFKLWEKEGPLSSLFRVYIDGAYLGRCRRVSGLGVRINVYEPVESDNIIKHKAPGHLEFNEVTIGQIIDVDDKLLAQFAQGVGRPLGPGDGYAVGSSLLLQDAKKNIDVHLLSRDGSVIAQWKLLDCWASVYRLGDFDVGGEDDATHEATVQVNGYVETDLGSGEFETWIANVLRCKVEKKFLVLRAYERCAKIGADQAIATWKCVNAFPAEIGFGDLDASSNDVLAREMTIVHEGLIPLPS